MLGEYLPILILLVLSVAFAAGSLIVASLVGPQRPNPTKLAAYECGNEPLAQVKGAQFSVKFYLVALSFLIFDVETVFFYPWALMVGPMGWFALAVMAVFIAILAVGLLYEFRVGALEWGSRDISELRSQAPVLHERSGGVAPADMADTSGRT